MAMALTRTRDIFAINPDGLLTAAASRKIVKYAAGYSETRGTACPSCQGFYQRSGKIHGELLRLLYYMAHPKALAYREAPGHRAPRHAPPL